MSRNQTIALAVAVTLAGAALKVLIGNEAALACLFIAGALMMYVMLAKNEDTADKAFFSTLPKPIDRSALSVEAKARAEEAEAKRDIARLERDKAIADASVRIREAKIEMYYNEIRRLALDARTHGSSIRIESVNAAIGEDKELVQEAWDRFQKARTQGFNRFIERIKRL